MMQERTCDEPYVHGPVPQVKQEQTHATVKRHVYCSFGGHAGDAALHTTRRSTGQQRLTADQGTDLTARTELTEQQAGRSGECRRDKQQLRGVVTLGGKDS